MMVPRKIIALAGLSGSGKTTLLRNLQGKSKFERLSASEVLKDRSAAAGRAVSSESLRLGNFDQNQRDLVEAFVERASAVEGNIVFDCHTAIDTPAGFQVIPAAVFRDIGATHMLFLSLDPEELIRRRSADHTRERPHRGLEELAEQQARAMEAGRAIALELGIRFTDIGTQPEQILAAMLAPDTNQLPG